eukprot:TRINITY_DN22289_c0_g2_i3.p1 TRINITY_DN22289_c0_g2~~TRINITY_DN22289_c0_g2_i3.p1  ORF type:complete len:1406 (-),score=398.97 TRINITY_DN22289_c0_g2_i3:265-4482(-)
MFELSGRGRHLQVGWSDEHAAASQRRQLAGTSPTSSVPSWGDTEEQIGSSDDDNFLTAVNSGGSSGRAYGAYGQGRHFGYNQRSREDEEAIERATTRVLVTFPKTWLQTLEENEDALLADCRALCAKMQRLGRGMADDSAAEKGRDLARQVLLRAPRRLAALMCIHAWWEQRSSIRVASGPLPDKLSPRPMRQRLADDAASYDSMWRSYDTYGSSSHQYGMAIMAGSFRGTESPEQILARPLLQVAAGGGGSPRAGHSPSGYSSPGMPESLPASPGSGIADMGSVRSHRQALVELKKYKAAAAAAKVQVEVLENLVQELRKENSTLHSQMLTLQPLTDMSSELSGVKYNLEARARLVEDLHQENEQLRAELSRRPPVGAGLEEACSALALKQELDVVRKERDGFQAKADEAHTLRKQMLTLSAERDELLARAKTQADMHVRTLEELRARHTSTQHRLEEAASGRQMLQTEIDGLQAEREELLRWQTDLPGASRGTGRKFGCDPAKFDMTLHIPQAAKGRRVDPFLPLHVEAWLAAMRQEVEWLAQEALRQCADLSATGEWPDRVRSQVTAAGLLAEPLAAIGDSSRQWQQGWYVLRNGVLACRGPGTDRLPFSLDDNLRVVCTSELKARFGRPFVFLLDPGGGSLEPRRVFDAGSSEALDAWLKALDQELQKVTQVAKLPSKTVEEFLEEQSLKDIETEATRALELRRVRADIEREFQKARSDIVQENEAFRRKVQDLQREVKMLRGCEASETLLVQENKELKQRNRGLQRELLETERHAKQDFASSEEARSGAMGQLGRKRSTQAVIEDMQRELQVVRAREAAASAENQKLLRRLQHLARGDELQDIEEVHDRLEQELRRNEHVMKELRHANSQLRECKQDRQKLQAQLSSKQLVQQPRGQADQAGEMLEFLWRTEEQSAAEVAELRGMLQEEQGLALLQSCSGDQSDVFRFDGAALQRQLARCRNEEQRFEELAEERGSALDQSRELLYTTEAQAARQVRRLKSELADSKAVGPAHVLQAKVYVLENDVQLLQTQLRESWAGFVSAEEAAHQAEFPRKLQLMELRSQKEEIQELERMRPQRQQLLEKCQAQQRHEELCRDLELAAMRELARMKTELYDQSEQAEVAEAAAEASAEALQYVENIKRLQCSKGHMVNTKTDGLRWYQVLTESGKICDVCGTLIEDSLPRWNCEHGCDYDVCAPCYEAASARTSPRTSPRATPRASPLHSPRGLWTGAGGGAGGEMTLGNTPATSARASYLFGELSPRTEVAEGIIQARQALEKLQNELRATDAGVQEAHHVAEIEHLQQMRIRLAPLLEEIAKTERQTLRRQQQVCADVQQREAVRLERWRARRHPHMAATRIQAAARGWKTRQSLAHLRRGQRSGSASEILLQAASKPHMQQWV